MIPGGWEWILIVVVIVLLFGARKLPELARSVGKSIVEFKAGMKDENKLKENEGESTEQAEEKAQ